jgi:hypothetical protein
MGSAVQILLEQISYFFDSGAARPHFRFKMYAYIRIFELTDLLEAAWQLAERKRLAVLVQF